MAQFVDCTAQFSPGSAYTVDIRDEIGLLLMEADRMGVNRYLRELPVRTLIWDCEINRFTALIDFSYGGSNTIGADWSGNGADWSGNGALGLSGDVFIFNGDGDTSAVDDLGMNVNNDRITTDAVLAIISVPIATYCPSSNRYQHLLGTQGVTPETSESLPLNNVAYKFSVDENNWATSKNSIPVTEQDGQSNRVPTHNITLASHSGTGAGGDASGLEQFSNVAVEFRVVCGSKLAVEDTRSESQMLALTANREYAYKAGGTNVETNQLYYKYYIEPILVEKYDHLLAQDKVQILPRRQRLLDEADTVAPDLLDFDVEAGQAATTWDNRPDVQLGAGVDELFHTQGMVSEAEEALDWKIEPYIHNLQISRRAISDMIHHNLDISNGETRLAGHKCDNITELRAAIDVSFRDLNMWGCCSTNKNFLKAPMKVHDQSIVGSGQSTYNLGSLQQLAVTGGEDGGTNERGWHMAATLLFIDPKPYVISPTNFTYMIGQNGTGGFGFNDGQTTLNSNGLIEFDANLSFDDRNFYDFTYQPAQGMRDWRKYNGFRLGIKCTTNNSTNAERGSYGALHNHQLSQLDAQGSNFYSNMSQGTGLFGAELSYWNQEHNTQLTNTSELPALPALNNNVEMWSRGIYRMYINIENEDSTGVIRVLNIELLDITKGNLVIQGADGNSHTIPEVTYQFDFKFDNIVDPKKNNDDLIDYGKYGINYDDSGNLIPDFGNNATYTCQLLENVSVGDTQLRLTGLPQGLNLVNLQKSTGTSGRDVTTEYENNTSNGLKVPKSLTDHTVAAVFVGEVGGTPDHYIITLKSGAHSVQADMLAGTVITLHGHPARRYQNNNSYLNKIGDNQLEGYGVQMRRDNIKSLSLSPYMRRTRWIGTDEKITLKFTDIELYS